MPYVYLRTAPKLGSRQKTVGVAWKGGVVLLANWSSVSIMLVGAWIA
jgi:hypothetical protein